MRTRLRQIVLRCGLCLAATSACEAQPQQLSGSLNLRYNNVRAYWVDRELVIAYQMPQDLPPQLSAFGAPLQNQVLRLVFNTARQALVEGAQTSLIGDSHFHNASLTHYVLAVSGGSGTLTQEAPVAALVDGTITVTALGKAAGEALRGKFSAKLADGHDVFAEFDTVLVKP